MGKPVKGMRQFTSHQRREIRSKLIEKYGAFCQICIQEHMSPIVAQIDMDSRYEDNSFSIDHIIPLNDGGPNVFENMQPTHIACNERKGSANGGGHVRSNRKPRTARPVVTQLTGNRLAYSSSSY